MFYSVFFRIFFNLSYLKRKFFLFLLCILFVLPSAFATPGGVNQNLTLWLNAENTSTLYQDSCGGTQSTSEGHRIACWEDLSGNGNDFTASGSVRPTLKTGSEAINFNPALDFDGTEDYLEDADGENYINGIDEFSTFVVVHSDVASADRYIFNSESGASNAESPWGLRFDDVGALSGKDDTLKTGINTGSPTLYEGNESNIAHANPLLASVHWTSAEAPALHVDGKNIQIHPATTKSGSLTGADYARIGHQGGHSFWQGTIAELIFYQRKITALEQQKVESYLAIKYGITLDNTNYINSSGTVFWNASANSSYNNDIAGIAKDSRSGLYQNKSISSNPNSLVTIQSDGVIDNGEALIWGNNNGSLTTTSTNAPSGMDILQRVWREDQTGSIGTVTITMDISGMNLSSTNSNNLFLVMNQNNANFSLVNGIKASSGNSSIVTFSNVDFTADNFFTIAVNDTFYPAISYTNPTKSNNTLIKQDYVEVNVSATDDHFANLTYKLYNSTFGLLNKTILNSVSIHNFTQLGQGVYYYNVTACDENNLCNTTETRKITLEQNPSVTNIYPSGQTINTSTVIGVNATIDDAIGVDTVIANITYPNNTITQLTLSSVGGNVYSANFTLSVAGKYNITIIANDTAGYENSTESSIFLAGLVDPNSITKILAWYDAADNATLFTDANCANQVTGDNQEVLCWENKAGGNNATVFSGKNGAKFRSTPTEKIGSATTLRFNKTNGTVYETGIDIRADTLEDITLFSVYRPRSTNVSDQGQALWGSDDGSWDRFYYSLFSQSVPLGTDGIDDGLVSLGGVSSGLAIDGAGIVDTVFLLTTVYNGNVSGAVNSGPVNGSQIYFDGNLQTSFTDQSHPTAAKNQLFLGWDGDNGGYDGDLAEIILYEGILSLCQIELVNNYLGEKYGKDFNGVSGKYGFSSPHDNDVNGITEYIGNCSVNTEITSAKSSIATIFNPNSLDVNDSLTFAHNDVGFSFDSNVPSGYTNRINKSWRVDVDNTPGNVSVSFDVSTTNILVGSSQFALLIDSNTNFSDATAHTTGFSVSGSVITFTDVNFSHGDYFTLAVNEIPPTIEFVSPTLSNATYHSENNFVVNVSSSSLTSHHYTFAEMDDSLLLWMRMDDTNSSGDPIDIADGNNGSLVGNARINDSGNFGKGVYLDGSGDYINLPASNTLLPNRNSWTISAWFNAKSIDSANFEDRIITLTNSSTNSAISLTLGKSNKLQFFYRNSGGSGITKNITAVSTNIWYHYAATYNGSTYKLYMNGVLNDSITDSINGMSSNNAKIGSNPAGSTEYFNGSIDEVLIFNRTLSSQEMLSLHNSSANQYENNFINLADGAHTFKGHAVAANGKKNQTLLRTVTVDATNPSVSYVSPTKNNNSFISTNFIFVNVSVTESNEANITFRLFNSTFGLLNQTTLAAGNRNINFTGLSDAVYYYNVTSRDLAGNAYTTSSRKITLDNANPSVTSIQPSAKAFNTSSVISVNASVTDTNLDTVIANVTYPNNTITQLTLSVISGNVYGGNFTIPVLAGKYNITILANDTAGNENNTESSFFTANLKDPSEISGLRVWYDATDNTTLYTDAACSTLVSSNNQEVRCWADKSSYKHNATNVSGKGVPRFVTNQFNGLSVLNFSKSESDTLRHELASQYTSDFTIFTVLQSRDSSPDTYESFFSNGEPADVNHFQIDYTTSGNAFRYGASTKFNFENFSNDIKLYSVTHDGNNVVLYNEGEQVNSGTTTEGRVFEHYRVNQNRNGEKHHDSRIGEIILYDRVLTACELEMVDIYLGEKYGKDFFGIRDNYGFGSPYNNDVNGIGQFPGNCSTTVDVSTAASSVATIFNASSLQLNDSLTIAHNNGGTSISTDAPASYRRINQSWRADEDDGGNGNGNSVGLVTLTFDISGNSNIANYDHFVLFIDDDGTFSNATVTSTGSKSGNTIKFTNVNFTNGDYFTLGFNDTTLPSVTALIPSEGTEFNETEAIEVGANITDSVGISQGIAQITLPNKSKENVTLSATGNKFNASFTTALIGLHNVTMFANDTSNNINNTENTSFRRTGGGPIDFVDFNYQPINAVFNITGNNSGILNMTVTVSLSPFQSITITNFNSSASPDFLLFLSNQSADNADFNQTFVIDASRIVFDNLTAVVNTTGDNLFQCSNVNTTQLGCSDFLEYSPVNKISINPGAYVFGTVVSNPNDIGDTTIYNQTANRNFGKITLMRVGRQGSSGDKVARVAIRFNLSNLPERTNVTNAQLKLFLNEIPGSDVEGDEEHEIHRIIPQRNWPETTATWNVYNGSSWTTPGGDFNATPTDTINISSGNESSYVSWNVTNDIKAFLLDQSINFGWIIKNKNETKASTRRDFRTKEYSNESQRPILIINYTLQNNASVIGSVLLNSTLERNTTAENITLHIINVTDANNDSTVNITNWYRNNKSLTLVNMPFESNAQESINATDYSGYGHNGTVSGATWKRIAGKVGGAYLFDGVNDYIKLPLTDELNITGKITLEAWVKSADNSHPGNDPTIIAKYGPESKRSFFLGVDDGPSDNDNLRFTLSSDCNNDNGSINVSSTLSAGEWTHVVGTWNGSLMILYKNGQQIGNASFSGSICDTNVPIQIGESPRQEGFEGYIDEVKIYNFSLTAQQVYQNFLSGNKSENTDVIVSQETIVDQTWHACVTPNDGFDDGQEVCSSMITILEDTNPSVVSLNVTPKSSFNLTDVFEIDVNVTDSSGVDTVSANITLPNGSINQINLSPSGNNYSNNFTAPGLIGTYTVRITSTDILGNKNSSETTTFEIQNSIPSTSGVSVNGGSAITLSSATNTTVIGTATITDLNGYTHISSVTGYFFLTESGVDASDNRSDHYTTTCTSNGDGSGSTVSYNCTFSVAHYAVPTDVGSNKSATNWTFLVSPQDAQGTGTNGTIVSEVNTLTSFTFVPSIVNFGDMNLGTNTTNINQKINVTNSGNSGLDVLLSGTNLSCSSGSVSVTFLEYKDAPFNYGAGVDLLESNVELDLDALPGSESNPTPKKTTYYGLRIPAVAVGGSCNGSIIITGKSDPNND